MFIGLKTTKTKKLNKFCRKEIFYWFFLFIYLLFLFNCFVYQIDAVRLDTDYCLSLIFYVHIL